MMERDGTRGDRTEIKRVNKSYMRYLRRKVYKIERIADRFRRNDAI